MLSVDLRCLTLNLNPRNLFIYTVVLPLRLFFQLRKCRHRLRSVSLHLMALLLWGMARCLIVLLKDFLVIISFRVIFFSLQLVRQSLLFHRLLELISRQHLWVYLHVILCVCLLSLLLINRPCRQICIFVE